MVFDREGSTPSAPTYSKAQSLVSGLYAVKRNRMEDELAESELTGWKLYGPYLRKDGRKHVCLIKHAEDGSIAIRRTKSYPKYLVEQRLGRLLRPNETVDHQDRDFTNDEISNLIVRKLNGHVSIDALRVNVEEVSCPICTVMFTPSKDQRNLKKNIAGPFCSRKCKGRYGSSVQAGAPTLNRTPIAKTYYRLNKEEHGIRVLAIVKQVYYIFETVKEAVEYTKDDYDLVYQGLCDNRKYITQRYVYGILTEP